MKRFNFKLDDETHKKLKIKAAKKDVSMAELVRQYINDNIKGE